MCGGKFRKITFEYRGFSVEAVLDKLPTAKIISENDGRYIIQVEVFGNKIHMWIRSQSDMIKVL